MNFKKIAEAKAISFFELKISMKLEKIRIFILQFDLENPRPD